MSMSYNYGEIRICDLLETKEDYVIKAIFNDANVTYYLLPDVFISNLIMTDVVSIMENFLDCKNFLYNIFMDGLEGYKFMKFNDFIKLITNLPAVEVMLEEEYNEGNFEIVLLPREMVEEEGEGKDVNSFKIMLEEEL